MRWLKKLQSEVENLLPMLYDRFPLRWWYITMCFFQEQLLFPFLCFTSADHLSRGYCSKTMQQVAIAFIQKGSLHNPFRIRKSVRRINKFFQIIYYWINFSLPLTRWRFCSFAGRIFFRCFFFAKGERLEEFTTQRRLLENLLQIGFHAVLFPAPQRGKNFARRAKSDKIFIFALKAPFTSNKYFEQKYYWWLSTAEEGNEISLSPSYAYRNENLLNCILNSK